MAEVSSTARYSERLYNEDLAPAKERTWTAYSLFAMWMADVHSIGGYTFAAGLFFLGLAGWQVFLGLIAGIALVYGALFGSGLLLLGRPAPGFIGVAVAVAALVVLVRTLPALWAAERVPQTTSRQ